jgi:hypothetical protein
MKRTKSARENYWKLLKEHRSESYKDLSDMLSMEFEDSSSSGETSADFVGNIFLYWEMWEEYLYCDSFERFGWLDVNITLLEEINYHPRIRLNAIIFVASFLISMGWFHLTIFYLLFVITWPMYDDESDVDLDDPKLVLEGVTTWAIMKSHWRMQAKKWKWRDSFRNWKKYPIEWRVCNALLNWPFDDYSVDGVHMIHIYKALGSQREPRTDLVNWKRTKYEYFNDRYHPHYFGSLAKSFKFLDKKGGHKGHFHFKGFLNYQTNHLNYREKKYELAFRGNMLFKDSATSYELYMLSLYVTHWYYFDELKSKGLKKNFYIL